MKLNEAELEVVQSHERYQIVHYRGYPGIKCLTCKLTSFNMNDIAERYCGNCHVFHEGGAA